LKYHQRCVTAHHEASHAVVAVHCGAAFEKVSIKATEGAAGMLIGLRLLAGHEDDAVRIGLAGIMGMRLMYRRWQAGLFERTRDDLDYVARSVMAMSNGSATLGWCIDDNARFLTRRWGTVASLARLLEQEDEIGRDAVLDHVRKTANLQVDPPAGPIDWRQLESRVLARIERRRAFDAGDLIAIAIENFRAV
jgi:hypothetical protein